jgi:hypothetical protein
LLGFPIIPEDGSDVFLLNVRLFLKYTVLHPRRQNFSLYLYMVDTKAWICTQTD